MPVQAPGLKHFIEILEVIADNKYVLGDRLVYIGISGPNLESTLSSIAMAQGQLGHARFFYHWVEDLQGYQGNRAEIKNQTGKAFPQILEIDNWISLMAILYTVNVGHKLVLKSFLQSGHVKITNRLQKVMVEQQDHLTFSSEWVQQLLNDKGAIPHKVNEELSKIIPEVERWLREIEESTSLRDEGFQDKEVNLVEDFHQSLSFLKSSKDEVNV